MLTTWLGLLWGLAQGIRHAVEPDHLAAVSTLVAERRSPRSAAAYAVVWGAGHALVLLVVGGALLVLRTRMPERTGAVFELVVAMMLVALGTRALWRALSTHRSDTHAPSRGRAAHVHLFGLPIAHQPLVVGCIHGLAGSGALAALVVAQMRSLAAGLTYMVLYGGGAALGMAMLAGLAGVPLARMAQTERGIPAILTATGALSLLLGLAWGWAAAGPALLR